MTERELLKECTPQIVEMACECQKMTGAEYANVKKEILENVPEQTKSFMSKVFMIIEKALS